MDNGNGKDFVSVPNILETVTRADLEQVCAETSAILGEMKDVINTHAEILGLHRYILEKYVPAPLLETGTKEYYKIRSAQIDAEEIHAGQTPANLC